MRYFIGLLVLLLVLSGCGGAQPQPQPEPQAPAEEPAEEPADTADEERADTTDEESADTADEERADDSPASQVGVIEMPTDMPEDQTAPIKEGLQNYLTEQGGSLPPETPIRVQIIESGIAFASLLPENDALQLVFLKQEGETWNVIAGPQAGGFTLEELQALGIPDDIAIHGVPIP